MLITPRKTDILDTLQSEIFTTPKRPLRGRSLSLSPSGSSPGGKVPSSPEKGVTFSATSFYKPRSEYLNPFERMVAGKPKIYVVTEPVLKPKNKPSKVKQNFIGKPNSASKSIKPSKTLKSGTVTKKFSKPSEQVLQKKVASVTKHNGPSKIQSNQKSPLKMESETKLNTPEVAKDSVESTPTKRSPRKSGSPSKRTSPRKGIPQKSGSPSTSPGKRSPRRRKFFVTRSPARDQKRWMTDAYTKTNILDFNKMSKLAKRPSPKSEPRKKIGFDQTGKSANTQKKTFDNRSGSTPTTGRSKRVALNVQDGFQNSPEATPIKQRRIESTSAGTPPTASSDKNQIDQSPKSSSGGKNRLSTNSRDRSLDADNQDACVEMGCENEFAENDNSPALVQPEKRVTPSKEGSGTSSASPKCYPIFEKTKNPNVEQQSRRSSPRKKFNKFAKSNGTDQMIIDAGQRDLGARQCPSCNMIYSVGDAHDELIHSKYHEEFFSILRYPGWKKERVVGEFSNGKVIKVIPSDPTFMMRKVEDVRTLVDRELGFCVFSVPKNPNAACFLYVTLDKKIAGCVIAESITSAFRVLPSSGPPSSPSRSTKGLYCSTEPSKALCGISRVWTEPMHRRQKIGTRLIDCLRGHFLYGQVLAINDIAFSDPTPVGKEFAAKYSGTETFLVYK